MGWVLVAVDVVVLGALVIAVVWYPSTMLDAWVTPSALIVITAFNFIALLCRAAVVADSYPSSTLAVQETASEASLALTSSRPALSISYAATATLPTRSSATSKQTSR